MDDLYLYLDQTFEWNRAKAARNAIKHHIRFPEAASVFFDESAKDRYLVLGGSIRSNLVLIVHVIRGERIRLLSARLATLSERRQYGEPRRGWIRDARGV